MDKILVKNKEGENIVYKFFLRDYREDSECKDDYSLRVKFYDKNREKFYSILIEKDPQIVYNKLKSYTHDFSLDKIDFDYDFDEYKA